MYLSAFLEWAQDAQHVVELSWKINIVLLYIHILQRCGSKSSKSCILLLTVELLYGVSGACLLLQVLCRHAEQQIQ